jgi:NAD(P)H dehydrogenase (quinone)
MGQARILVTGATGATGTAAVRLLREWGESVRALVRKEDERSDALKGQGVEIVVGDLLDFDAVRGAVEGIQCAYFMFPIEPGILEATAYFAQAAQEAGVKAIVNMSQASARRAAQSHAARNHWISERLFEWSGIPVTHLRPTLFAEWILYFAKAIKAGVLPLSMETGVHAPLAAGDIARVIAKILVSPEAHRGQAYMLYGAKEMTFPQMAAEMSHILGKPVKFKATDVATLRMMLEGAGGKYANDFFWQHMQAITVDHQNGVFAGTNELVEKIGGRKPMTLAEFVEENRAKLTD